MPNVADTDQINAAKETFITLLDISRLLRTNLDPEVLTLCIRIIEAGVNPEALAFVVRELKKKTSQSTDHKYEENELD